MASATPSYASTKETTYYARLCRLLVDVGSQVLRDKFDSIHPPAGLYGVLTKPPVHPTLQNLRRRKILNPTQWDKLYPTNPLTLSSKDFDVTLLMLLLRNICGLTPPATGWDSLPPAADTSVEANIARVKYYRNHVYGHANQASVDNPTFNSYWQDISNALIGLGADAASIRKLKTESMDPVIEKHYNELLGEWKKDDESTKDKLDKIEDQLKQMNVQVLESQQTISEKLRSLTDSVNPVEADHSKEKDYLEEIKSELGNISEQLQTLLAKPREELRPLRDKGVFDLVDVIGGIRQLYRLREGSFAPFPWCEEFRFNINDIFTDLKFSRKKGTGTETFETVTMYDIFRPHEECQQPRTVLIEGKPGMGKSSFCDKLAYDWATEKQGPERSSGNSLSNFQVVLLLKCRDIALNIKGRSDEQPLSRDVKDKEECKSVLWDAIEEQLLPLDITKEEKKEFFRFVRQNQSSVLLVLDGLDWLPTNMLPAFKEIIQGRILPKCHIVVTARKKVGIKLRGFCDCLVEILGFTKENAETFIVKYFKTEVGLARKLLDKLKLDINLRQLTENPLNTALLCLLCEDFNGIFPESGTQLYLEIIECVLRRYSKKRELPESQHENLTQVYKPQLKLLGSIALTCLLNDNTAYFEENKFRDSASEILGFGFLFVERSRRKLRPCLYYCFPHKPLQELFAAFYLSCQLLDSKISLETLLADDRYFHELRQVLMFTWRLIALQCEEMIEAFVQIFANKVNRVSKGVSDELLVALQCINECKNERRKLHLQLAGNLGSFLQIRKAEIMFPYQPYISTSIVAVVAEAIKHNSTITQMDLSGDVFHTDCSAVLALAEAIKQNSTITKLELSIFLGHTNCTALAEAIRHNSTITQLDLSKNQLGAANCTALAEAISHNSTITQLDLSHNNLGAAGCAALAEAIKHNSTIKELHLCDNDLGAGDCNALGKVIKHNSTITQLDVSCNHLGAAGCTALAEVIEHNSTITQLNLSQNRLIKGNCSALAKAIRHNSTITQLCLSENELSFEGDSTALAEAIEHNSTITQLDVSWNNLGATGCTALAEAIKQNSTITQLNLSGNLDLGPAGCIELLEAIKHNSTISQLNLSWNNLSAACSTALAKVIEHNSTITQLNLSDNKLFEGDCTALVEAIKYNSTIAQLDLSHNDLGAGECTALAEAIKHNSTITQLNLSWNTLGTASCTALAEAIKHNSSITQLDLSGNIIGAANFAAIAEAIKHNSSITQLDLSGNYLSDAGCTALAEKIKHNSTITLLDLSWNNLSAAACTAFAEVIKQNSTIKQLIWAMNNHSATCCPALAEAIKLNSEITVDFSYVARKRRLFYLE